MFMRRNSKATAAPMESSPITASSGATEGSVRFNHGENGGVEHTIDQAKHC